MTISRRVFASSLVLGSLGLAPVRAAGQRQGYHSRARLFSGAASGGRADLLAGVQIELDPGFKTYWRNPGESGLPAAFDWSGSENLANAEVLWPAPTRFEDASGVSYGYVDNVTFPIRVAAREAGKPVLLALTLDYGVCKDICIPAHAELSLALPGSGETRDRMLIEQALARVPRPTPLGAEGPLSILTVQTDPNPPDAILVTARTPRNAAPRLFPEPPPGWFVADAAPESLASPGAPDVGTYRLQILERPRTVQGPVELRVTLVAGERAVETTAILDTAPLLR